MIARQMTTDLFEYNLEVMIEGPEYGGAATYIETVCNLDVNLFI
jgi:peroxiredoxin family protein